MTFQNKRLVIIILIVLAFLLVPFIAMQFSDEVNWSLSDFVIAGLLIFGTGVLIDFVLRKTKKTNYKILAIIAIALIFLLIWVELAVGIFGTPFAGS